MGAEVPVGETEATARVDGDVEVAVLAGIEVEVDVGVVWANGAWASGKMPRRRDAGKRFELR